MKMNKIVLASLLSVSLLGTSTSVFATSTDATSTSNDTTNATFEITHGTKSVTSATQNIKFDSINLADLMTAENGSKTTYSQNDVAVRVNDTTADNQGWTLKAEYSGMKAADQDSPALGETLTIGGVALKAKDNKDIVTADPADVMAKLTAEAQGNTDEKFTANTVSLNVPASPNAAVKSYTGTIHWTLAPDTNTTGKTGE